MKFKLYSILGLGLLSLIGCGGGGGGGSSTPSNSGPVDHSTYAVTLSWETPTSQSGGTPLADLAGYNLYLGTSPQSYTDVTDVGKVKTYTITNLPGGTYYFVITAYDSAGSETEYSDEVKKTVP